MLGSLCRWEVLQYTSWCPNGHFSLRPAPWNLDQAWSPQARLNNKLILSWCTATSALPYLDYAWPYEEVWERFSFCIILSVKTPPLLLQSSLVLSRKADFAEAFVFWIPWIPIKAAAISNLALIFHSWSCTNLSLRRRLCNMLGICLQSQHSFKIWAILHNSIETSENILQF